MKMYKSMQFNMILNLLKTVFNVLFPLLIFKYVTNVLNQEGIGTINYCSSIVQYFTIIAGLGISTYATRECAKVRDDVKKITRIANELFSINIISMCFSYLCLFLALISIKKLNSYSTIIMIQSLSIFFCVLGVDWVNIVYEDYTYITIRTIVVQLTAFVLTIVFVKNETDYIVYAIITVCATGFTNLLNYFYVRKYINIHLCFSKNLIQHLKPIFIIFFMNIQISIFVNSDITILGTLKGEVDVAIYSVAVKVYSTIKILLASITSVAVPRLSYDYEKNRNLYYRNIELVLSIMLCLGIPVVMGLMLIPEFLIITVSSKQYLDACLALRILGVAIIPTLISTIVNNNILMAERKEKNALFSTTASSILNVALNVVLIPMWGYNGAAFTTLLAELMVLFICIFQAKDTICSLNNIEIFKNILKVMMGCVPMCMIYALFSKYLQLNYVCYLVFVIISVVSYLVVEFVLKNNTLLSFLK